MRLGICLPYTWCDRTWVGLDLADLAVEAGIEVSLATNGSPATGVHHRWDQEAATGRRDSPGWIERCTHVLWVGHDRDRRRDELVRLARARRVVPMLLPTCSELRSDDISRLQSYLVVLATHNLLSLLQGDVPGLVNLPWHPEPQDGDRSSQDVYISLGRRDGRMRRLLLRDLASSLPVDAGRLTLGVDGGWPAPDCRAWERLVERHPGQLAMACRESWSRRLDTHAAHHLSIDWRSVPELGVSPALSRSCGQAACVLPCPAGDVTARELVSRVSRPPSLSSLLAKAYRVDHPPLPSRQGRRLGMATRWRQLLSSRDT